MNIAAEIGDRIRGLRKKKGITAVRFAADTGFHRAYVHQVERGDANLSSAAIEKIARYLGCSIEYLKGEKEDEEIKVTERELVPDEKHFILLFRSLNNEEKKIVVRIARGLTATRNNKQVHEEKAFPVRLLVDVAAGEPADAVRQPDELEVPESFLLRGEAVAARVRGDSMIDIGIKGGDVVVGRAVNQSKNYKIGDVVIARIDESELTVKRYAGRENGKRKLLPENAAYEPLEFEEERCQIEAVITARRDQDGNWFPVNWQSIKGRKN